MTRSLLALLALLLLTAACAHRQARNDEVTSSMTPADTRALDGRPPAAPPDAGPR